MTHLPFKQIWKVSRWLVTLGVVSLMSYAFYHNRTDIAQAFGNANWFWLGLALGLNLLASLIYVGVWFSCARLLGSKRGYGAALMSLSVAGAARYIPGGIWPLAGLVFFGPAAGLARWLMPILALLAQGVHLLVAALIGVAGLLVALPLLTNGGFIPNPAYFIGLLLLFLLGWFALIFGPRYLTPLLLRLARWRSGQQATYSLKLANGVLFQPAWPSVLFWLANGLRLWLVIMAFTAINISWWPYLVWAGAFTTLVSALFFFVPLGLGIVEGSLALLLGALLAWPVVLGVVAANRLMRTLNDIIFLGIGLWLYRQLQAQTTPPD
jgi:hypothetical protein